MEINREFGKMKRQRIMFQMKEQGKNLIKSTNELDINELPSKEIKVIIIEMLIELRRVDKHSENFSKDLEIIKKKQTELKNIVTNKNTLEGINRRLEDTEGQTSKLEDSIVELTQATEKKKFFLMRTV